MIFVLDEGESRVAATYRDNDKRLAPFKKKYNPINLLRANQNIASAG